ncbi:MAG: PAS domain S-box protein [Deltaproteobacteria bacterium]|nr:PAS domain S-box protein [Deltaproteobacteria bacterium]
MASLDRSKGIEDSLRQEEAKRRKREGMVMLIATVMVLLFASFELLIPEISTEYSLTNNIAFFLLVNINIILLVLLVFLVVRSLVKLLFERRRNILGSRLRVRLVLVFIGLSLIPTLLLFFIAGGFVTKSFEKWFGVQVANALRGSLEIGETYYQNSANNALFYARQLSRRITEAGLFDPKSMDGLKAFVEAKQREYNLGTVEIFSPDRKPLVVAFNDKVPTGITVKPESEFLNRALRGLEVTRTQGFGEGDIIRGAVPVKSQDDKILGVVVVDYFVPKSVAKRALQIRRSYDEHKNMAIFKEDIKNTYLMTLVLVTLVIIFSATWFGLYLAKGITGPIQKLAEGTHEVAHGNWDYQIDTSGDDEIGMLVGSFNQMTRDLKQINTELEQRRRYMETLLANVTAGVVFVDQQGRITTINRAAEQVLGLDAGEVLGKRYNEVFQSDSLVVLREIIDGVQGSRGIEREIKVTRSDRILTLLVTADTLRDDAEKILGVMMFVEDITEIQKVQRMEAWREVARRIAHEIKNPLTPIRLSAQRLRKRYEHLLEGNGAVLEKCTSTIIKQVEELKNLVDEFSNFARLPTAKLAPNDLNQVVKEALFLFKEGHKDLEFRFDRQGDLPLLELDREQIKRVLINLLDNAVAVVGEGGRIEISTEYDPSLGIVHLEVADNGCGMSPEVRENIFEPYFSTKKDGTGLGLAIVSAIVSDHRGYIRVRPNEPTGTRFIIELPVTTQDRSAEVTKREHGLSI